MYLKLSVPKRQISRISKVKRAFYHDTSFDGLEEADPSESVDLHLPWIEISIGAWTTLSIKFGDIPYRILLFLVICLNVMAEPIVAPRCTPYTVKM